MNTNQTTPIEISTKEKNNNIIMNFLLKTSKISQFLMTLMDYNNNLEIDLLAKPEEFNKIENELMTLVNKVYEMVRKIHEKNESKQPTTEPTNN